MGLQLSAQASYFQCLLVRLRPEIDEPNPQSPTAFNACWCD